MPGAVTASPLEKPAGGGIRPRGHHHFQECVANREHRVDQAELPHPRIAEWLWPAEGPA